MTHTPPTFHTVRHVHDRDGRKTRKAVPSHWVGATIATMVVVSIAAGAQSVNSPFANTKKKQAWETGPQPSAQAVPQRPVPSQAPASSYTAPSYTAPTYTAPTYTAPVAAATSNSYSAPAYSAPTPPVTPQPAPAYSAPSSSALTSNVPAKWAVGSRTAPAQAGNYVPSQTAASQRGQYRGYGDPSARIPAPQDGTHYPGRAKTASTYAAQPQYAQAQAQAQQARSFGQAAPRQPTASGPYAPQSNAQNAQSQPNYNRGYAGPNTVPYPAKRSWKDRLGLSNLATTLTGFFKIGAAATDADTRRDDGWRADFIADGLVRGEVSAITQGGLEYGVGGKLRAQYDKYRRGFGGRVGDCPPDVAGCASVDVGGTPTALRGHTSQFYTAGEDFAKDTDIALEGAYLFLRSAYGDVTVGRDDGAAYLFSLGAPSLVAVNASNASVDYTGLDSVKTVNDASGFAEKIAYVSPRLLGDQIGVGVQFGASFAPDAKACGVDYCVRSSDASGALSPDLKTVVELGLALDRTFDNGLSVEATATYATATEDSALAAFDDLQAFGAGLEFALKGWRLGGSYLNSNNGLQDGDYTAYDVGLSYKPGKLGGSISYGHATDDNVGLTSDQVTLGLVYDINKRFTVGTGVQYIQRDVPVAAGTIISSQREKAAAVFVEGGVTF